MEKEINEKTMDFASEMYDFIERPEKKVTDFPAEFQAAAKAAVQMKMTGPRTKITTAGAASSGG